MTPCIVTFFILAEIPIYIKAMEYNGVHRNINDFHSFLTEI